MKNPWTISCPRPSEEFVPETTNKQNIFSIRAECIKIKSEIISIASKRGPIYINISARGPRA